MSKELDLHGFTINEAKDKILNMAAVNGFPDKLITGSGPLQAAIRAWLEEYDVEYFVPQYNMGIILILD